MTSSYILDLVCTRCGHTQSDQSTVMRCERCDGFTQARYDLAKASTALDRDRVSARHGGLWRFRELLPVRNDENIVTLGEGGTPLLKSRAIGPAMGLKNLYFKDLSRNPTASFKDYSSSTSIAKAREIGVKGVVLVSAGNASASFAAYCAVAGLPFHALTLPGSYEAMMVQNAIFGAQSHRVDGNSVVAGAMAHKMAVQDGLMDAAVPANPYRVEGKKVIGYEIAEALGWRAPDRIVCPTAGGTSIMALDKGFAELRELGWVTGTPAFDCVQAESCRPVVDSWRTGEPQVGAKAPNSIAIGLLSANPEAGSFLIEIMHRTGGKGTDVPDTEIRDAQRRLARQEGLFVEPSSAAALAGLERLRASGAIGDDETVVLMLTGSGLKGIETIAPTLGL